ncbi:unnamed protein product [Linum tenue]|uniref:GPI inositol-deacylase n=1 Tax=Linum tenue TaxID=586396 RepID=A0AAV0HI33_9ROSI|nr:unnamed protein product [Linum tenue]
MQGLGNNSADYASLQLTLQGEYGVPTVVAKVSRVDWLRNAAGLLDPSYWSGTLKPRPVLDWYLKRVDDAVQEAKAIAQGDETLSLIGHSAGGWLARVYMEEFGVSDISLLLTLGTPHLPPPKGIPGVIDQTRGLLYYVEEHCRKAVFTPQLKYVCVAGRCVGEQTCGEMEWCLRNQPIWRVRSTLPWTEFTTRQLAHPTTPSALGMALLASSNSGFTISSTKQEVELESSVQMVSYRKLYQ